MMTSRERLKTIFAGGKPDRPGFWLGNPHADTMPIYLKHFGVNDEEALRRMLGDDFRWIYAQAAPYRHPEGRPVWENEHRAEAGLASAGVFANCEDVREVEEFPWPNPDYLDFTDTLSALKNAGDVYRASGMWSCFFHDVADFFGMEN